jgi:MoaA/NifB/PqqE/SkfB family radical SAM enzyme
MNAALHALQGVLHSGHRPATPTDLLFFVTDRCNARCGHCFFHYAIDAGDGRDPLDLPRIERLCHSLREPLHSLVLTGGEPFLRDDLAEICALFRRINGVQRIYLPTNGLLTDRVQHQVERICRAGAASIVVQVSLDGLEQTHDRIRGARGSFRRAVSTAATLKDLQRGYPSLEVTINTTLSGQNMAELESLAAFVQSDLALAHSFEVVRGAQFRDLTGLDPSLASDASPADPTHRPPAPGELRALYPRLERIYRRNSRVRAREQPFLAAFIYAYRVRRFWHLLDVVEKRRPFRCPAGGSMGVIYPTGDVALCELSRPIGNLAAVGDDFHTLWTSSQADAMRARLRRCFCTHGCFQSVAMLREPPMWGRMLLSAARYVTGMRG